MLLPPRAGLLVALRVSPVEEAAAGEGLGFVETGDSCPVMRPGAGIDSLDVPEGAAPTVSMEAKMLPVPPEEEPVLDGAVGE